MFYAAVHSLIHSLACMLSCSLTYSFVIYSFIHFRSSIHSFISSLTHKCTYNRVHVACIQWLTRPFFSSDNSKGLRHVSDFMMSFLAMECCNKNGKFMPILLDEDSHQHIPLFLGNYFSYRWPEQEQRMENIIHKRPEFLIPVSSSRIQGSQKVFGLKSVSSPPPMSSSESKCTKRSMGKCVS